MNAPHLLFGVEGEGRAEAWLLAQGWQIVERNFRCKGGELDVVATKGDVLAFVEVKSRSAVGEDHFQPEVGVSPKKIRRLVTAARLWLLKHDDEIDGLFPRFDVITVVGRDDLAKIEHLEDAFEAPGG